MLRIYICPKCYNYRMVSKKPDAICFHCGNRLDKCEFEYRDFIDMSEEQRNLYKERYMNRMLAYQNKINNTTLEKNKCESTIPTI